MGSFFTVAIVAVVLVRSIPELRRHWRDDRAGVLKALKIVGLYVLFCSVGLGIGLLVLPEPGPGNETAAGIFTLFVMGWIIYGGVWLVRLVPRERALPSRIARPGAVDVVFLVTIGAALAWLTP